MLKKGSNDNWKPLYGNDSRPWLLKSEFITKTSNEEDLYQLNDYKESSKEGIRKKMLRQFFWQEISEEMFKELTEDDNKAVIDDTEYKENFKHEGSHILPQKCDLELHKKYPLYLDTPMTIWYEKCSSLPGSTLPPNMRPKDMFHKTSSITKSIDGI
uniref:Uncharacterized protein n=1 Tax=Clastoptera arizonana TaxID=38151 RepID=A0A1B6CF35_9HEMI